jgi:hypothetical protein
MSYGCGVPERLWKNMPKLKADTFMLYTRTKEDKILQFENKQSQQLREFSIGAKASDICFLYEQALNTDITPIQ